MNVDYSIYGVKGLVGVYWEAYPTLIKAVCRPYVKCVDIHKALEREIYYIYCSFKSITVRRVIVNEYRHLVYIELLRNKE